MNNDHKKEYINSDIVENALQIENFENQKNDKLRAYINNIFTSLEIETMKYIAQNLESKEIAQIQNVEKSTVERRKERIFEKASKYLPEMVVPRKIILSIKNIVYSYHLLGNDESDEAFIDRLETFIKLNKNR